MVVYICRGEGLLQFLGQPGLHTSILSQREGGEDGEGERRRGKEPGREEGGREGEKDDRAWRDGSVDKVFAALM